MKKFLKLGFAALLFVFVFTVLSNLGAVKASADTLSADLDGDGSDETIVYEITETGDYSLELTSLTINGKDVLSVAKFEDHFQANRINLEVIDTCAKDGLKELAVIKGVDSWDIYTLFRFKDGKVSQYCIMDGPDEIVSQKTKGRIKVRTYVSVRGIGNVRVDEVYKVKKGKAVLYTKTYKPNKLNETKTFKATAEPIIFKNTKWTAEAGTLRNGDKFTLVKFTRDKEGVFTQVYIKTKSGVKGWINTKDYDYSTFLVENPPVWD